MLEKSKNLNVSVKYDGSVHVLVTTIDMLVVIVSSAMRGRVYLPQDELKQFGLSDKDVFSGEVTEGWREFTRHQIARARFYFNMAEEGASHLDKDSRWPVLITPKIHNLGK